MDNIITSQDQWEGFGAASAEDVHLLMKALEANETVTDVKDLAGAGALQVQSLESTLVMLTHQEKHLTLWRDVPKDAARSTLEEYSVQFGHGQNESGWVEQMENPIEADALLARDYSFIKFQRQMWKFSDVSGMVQTISPVETLQKQSASLRALRAINRALYSGDSDFFAQSIDGFEKTIRGNGSADHVVDLRGAAPTQQHFRLAAELITANFGNVEGCGLYLSPGAQSTIDQIMETAGTQRFLQNQLPGDGGLSMGFGIRRIFTSFGSILPKVDIFLAGEYESRGVPKTPDPANPRTLIEGKTSAQAPDSPSVVVTTQAGPVAGSKWAATGARPAAATYRYRVAAGNRFGLSAACAAADAGADVVAGGSNTLAITKAGTGNAPTYYEIYSEAVEGDGKYLFIGRIKDTAGAASFVDKNASIPGTTRMFLLDLSSVGEMRTFQLKRLGAMHSQEFARIGSYRWGTVNLYATPQFYAPLRFVMFENMPVSLNSASQYLNI